MLKLHKSFTAGLFVACAALTACSGGSSQDHSMHGQNAGGDQAGGGMPMNMGDPNATPAKDVAGAQLRSGAFTLLPTRPPGHEQAAGTAWLAIHPGGTTATLEMTGLAPGTKYMAHLHAKPCSEEDGGGHFQFDPAGPEMPPNEIHLGFAADAGGRGFMTAENEKPAEAAKSLVVHPAEFSDNRIACADL
ncbi:superoxide dismutase family protein [Saccharopolyspora rhizosphaerae]|uniref:Superoxide dismutase family protein n=1 Tax=Saccharopolyspora rhizosphaerae TaxID=2492662 RepID=A0A3R8NYY1_9PSEU|nr:superoxide dismutase family protein [Saccharopolyspora rhizosphaerae]RRO12896.1 superoxide dismutase family protein [Saccharopolyspora rhizosphaerae]